MSILFSHFFQKINQIAPLEHDFTEVLESIALKPKILYFRGKLPENVSKMGKTGVAKQPQNPPKNPPTTTPKSTLQRPKTVAIVGSRHNTRYGEEVAYEMAHKLAQRGVVIVSGLAYGIDSIAHRAALDAGGITVAVLGTPIDRIYPKEHISLAAEIVEKGGAIISEYAPDTPADQPALDYLSPGEYYDDQGRRRQHPRSSFLHRNRLISGLADIVVVVEAAQKSGSLSTAAHALNQGKDVFAVPGNITNIYSQGCNRLIAQGATPYTTPNDLLRQLFPEDFLKKPRNHHTIKGDTATETAILRLIAAGTRNGEHLMAQLGLSAPVFNQVITLLEIKGLIRSLGANHWALQ